MQPDPIPLCVNGAADVVAAYPRQYRTDEHPVLDAAAEALAAMHSMYQDASDNAAAQSDILRATGIYLDGLAEDRGVARASGESDDAYRARTIAWKSVVTPSAILGIVNTILASYGVGKVAQLFESILDRWFVEDGTTDWCCPICTSDTLIGPSYPNRLYPDDALLNDGQFRPQSDPGEALTFAYDEGRMFVLRVPADAGIVDELPDEVFAAIINSVNRIVGQSIVWAMWVDPRLGR